MYTYCAVLYYNGVMFVCNYCIVQKPREVIDIVTDAFTDNITNAFADTVTEDVTTTRCFKHLIDGRNRNSRINVSRVEY